jgi:hypothetical protein
VELVGTAFAITKSHILTAYHNILIDPEDYKSGIPNKQIVITNIVTKEIDQHVVCDPIYCSFVDGNVIEDWAILEVNNPSNYFNRYFPIGDADTIKPEQLRVLHAPIGFYRNNSVRLLQIWGGGYQRVLQYDDDVNDVHQVLIESGLYRGSCGAPYLTDDGTVIAMHLSSSHEGKDISWTNRKRLKRFQAQLTETQDAITDASDIHSSISTGLVLSHIKTIVEFVKSKI